MHMYVCISTGENCKNVCICVQPYLKVGELGVVKVRVDVQRGAHH